MRIAYRFEDHCAATPSEIIAADRRSIPTIYQHGYGSIVARPRSSHIGSTINSFGSISIAVRSTTPA